MDPRPKLIITGANGFTGHHAYNHFSKLGYDVIGITRKQTFMGKENMKNENCDLTNKKDVAMLVERIKPDYLLHLAGQNSVVDSWKDPIGTLDINLMSAAYLLEAIRKVNPSCKILIAGSALQIDPVNLSNIPHPYSLSKTLQEIVSVAWKKLFKMNIVITKPTNLIGPGCSNGINSIIASKIVKMERNEADPILIVNNLNATRDFLDVRDAVNAYEILLNKGESGEVYDICTGISRTIREMIDIYKNLTDVNLEVKATSNQSGSEVETRKPSKLFELGWKPSIPFEASLRDTIEFFRTNPEICI